MRWALGILGILLVFGIQVAGWPEITLRIAPAWLLAFAAAWGMATTMRQGFVLAVAGGVLLDLYAGPHFGMFTAATLVGYGILYAYVVTRPGELTGLFQISLFAAAAAAYELVVLLVITLSTSHFPFFAELFQVATLNIAGSVIVFAILAPVLKLLARALSPYAPRPIQY